MKAFDRLLQRWRIAKARAFIAPGSRVLDVGCADGALFDQIGSLIAEGVGIDPDLAGSVHGGRFRLTRGRFPDDLPDGEPFDAIAMLAVLQHVPPDRQVRLAEGCARFLRPGGRLIVTVPSPKVDHLVDLLRLLRIADGMSLEQHHGFEVGKTTTLFSAVGFSLLVSRRFPLGLTNLFVLGRTGDPGLA